MVWHVNNNVYSRAEFVSKKSVTFAEDVSAICYVESLLSLSCAVTHLSQH